MTLEDLQYIFQHQIDEGDNSLYFMLDDNGHKTIQRHPVTDIETLVPMLDCFEFHYDIMPRFTK